MSQFESFLAGARFDGRALAVTRLDYDDVAGLVARGRRLRAEAIAGTLGRIIGLPRRIVGRLDAFGASGGPPLSAVGGR